MASLIAGFEYDIFISYRQKDNKGEKWVSEFVESLTTELESAFKENVSVYFDINPTDGLLETYDVEDSLKKKLKCLVFIPIISRTYCDPNSFAWEHEFKAFAGQSVADQFGLKITLPNGNVINRILPIRIHDLDLADLKLCESVLGGALRGVDFVYKTSGVNRPLRPAEEHPQDNIYKTYYRDQINKVANAIKDIITSIRKTDLHDVVTQEKGSGAHSQTKPNKAILYIGSAIATMILVLLYVFIRSISGSPDTLEKTIAVLPFDKWFSNKDYSYLGDQIPSMINFELRRINSIDVISFNSTRHYQFPDITRSRVIGKECGANILVQGSIELLNNDNDISIQIQLINSNTENTIWNNKFKCKLDSLQSIRSKIVFGIAQAMKVKLTPGEIEQFQTGVTKNSDAYSNFLSGNYQEEATALASIGKIYQDSISYERAINFYDKAIKYDSTFALAYARRSISLSSAYYTLAMNGKGTIEKSKADADKAIRLNPDLAEAYNADGFYYYYCKKDYKNALVCFKKASELDPGNWQPVFYTSMVYRRMGEWSNSQALIARVLKRNPQDALVLTNIGTSYCYLRIYDSALIYNNMAIKLMPNWSSPYINKLLALLLRNGDTHEARNFIDTASKNTGYRFQKDKIMLDIYDGKFNDALFKTELSEQDDFDNQGDRLLHYAYIYGYLGRHERAKTYYDSALVFYVKRLGKQSDPLDYIQAGQAYAGLNNYTKAIQSAKKGIELINDPLKKYDNLIQVAEIYIKCGDYKNGLKKLDELLNNPSNLSVKLLMLDPVWNPVKNNPEFIKLLNNKQ